MRINNVEINQIIVTNSENEVLAVISDDEIIEHDGYKVILDFIE